MRVYLFDIDGTLISSGGAGKAAMETALTTAFGVSVNGDAIPYSGRTDRAIGHDLLRHHGIAETADNWQKLLAHYLGHLPEMLPRHPGYVMPGIAALLEQLQLLNAPVGLLTGNVRDGARLKLSHFRLFHHFAFGGFGDDHHDRDDVAREALAVVHRQFNGSVAADEIWVIGDTPLDVACARAIGAGRRRGNWLAFDGRIGGVQTRFAVRRPFGRFHAGGWRLKG